MNGAPALRHFRCDGDEPSTVSAGISLGEVFGFLQIAATNFDILGLTTGTVMNLGLLVSLLHHPAPKIDKNSVYMKNTMPIRVRLARFLEECYVHRAQPHYLPEFALFGLLVIIAAWPVV